MQNKKKAAPLTGKVNAATLGHATATSKKNATSLKAENFKLRPNQKLQQSHNISGLLAMDEAAKKRIDQALKKQPFPFTENDIVQHPWFIEIAKQFDEVNQEWYNESDKRRTAELQAANLKNQLAFCEKQNAAYADFMAKDKATQPPTGSTAAYNGLQLLVNINPERDGSTGCSHYNKLNLTRADKGFVFPSVLFTDMPPQTFKNIFEQVFISNDKDGNFLWVDSYINFNSNVNHTVTFLLEMEKKARLSFNVYDIYSELYWVLNFFERLIKERLFVPQDEVLFQMAFREFGNLQDFANRVCKAIAMICEYYIGQPKMDMIDEYLNAHRKLLEFAIECSYYFNNLKN